MAVEEVLVIELKDYIEMMENLVKNSTLEQCMNTDLGDKARTLRREKSDATVKHSAHLNQQRESCGRSPGLHSCQADSEQPVYALP